MLLSPSKLISLRGRSVVAAIALEPIQVDIFSQGEVLRISDLRLIQGIMNAVDIPVMSKCRIGLFVEARNFEALGAQFIDESEALTPADEKYGVNEDQFDTCFVCGCRNLRKAPKYLGQDTVMLSTKEEPGTGDIVDVARHMRRVQGDIRKLSSIRDDELMVAARDRCASPG
jgi:pyridoxal 5'-phosphate synthase pdxS subunit